MSDPLFWLGLSLLLVAVSLTAVLIAALPAFRDLSRAARSAEKLFDTLHRDFPPTLEAIRLTGLEITELTDELNDGVAHASHVAQQVDTSLSTMRQQVRRAHRGTHTVLVGLRAAWQVLRRPPRRPKASPRLTDQTRMLPSGRDRTRPPRRNDP